MEYSGVDRSGHPYVKIPLGWDDPDAFVRLTMVEGDAVKESTVRINKEQNGKVFPGPEIYTDHIPRMVEGLMMVFNTLEENLEK